MGEDEVNPATCTDWPVKILQASKGKLTGIEKGNVSPSVVQYQMPRINLRSTYLRDKQG